MNSIQDKFQTAVSLHQQGNVDAAAKQYERLLRKDPKHAGAWHLLGVCRQQQGRIAEAIDLIGRAIGIENSRAAYFNNYAVALRSAGRIEEAKQAVTRALELNPEYADAHSNLGLIANQLGDVTHAVNAFHRALRLQPNHRDALYNLANTYRESGRIPESISLYRQSLAQDPDRPQVLNNLAAALIQTHQHDEAEQLLHKAIGLNRELAEAHLNLGNVHNHGGLAQEALQSYAEAIRLRPDEPQWRLRPLGTCPVIFSTTDELDRYRQRLERDLDTTLEKKPNFTVDRLLTQGVIPSFQLSHHDRNNRAIKQKFAALFEDLFRNDTAAPSGSDKIRVGFNVTQNHQGGFLRSMTGVLKKLDRKRFEIAMICSDTIVESCRKTLACDDIEWYPARSSLTHWRDQARAARCDVLYHWQIGTDPFNYFSAFFRAAPVQCTSWGTHVTSGVPTIDYYLSSELIETDASDDHYTESLVRFPSFPSFQRRPTLPPPAVRADFGLPETGGLYLCPQRLAKFIPDNDLLIKNILDADANGHVVILEGKNKSELKRLLARFERTLGPASRRVITMPNLEYPRFMQLLSISDALLDLPNYSLGVMAFDVLAVGLPIVTIPGTYHVGRYMHGLYRRMGLEHLITHNQREYVELATRLGQDRDFQKKMQSKIIESSESVFEDNQVIKDHETFFIESVEKHHATELSQNTLPDKNTPGIEGSAT